MRCYMVLQHYRHHHHHHHHHRHHRHYHHLIHNIAKWSRNVYIYIYMWICDNVLKFVSRPPGVILETIAIQWREIELYKRII